MAQPKNAMEIFKVLNKSNCKDCNESTCLAFAGAVFTGKKQINECPHLESDVIERFKGEPADQPPDEREVQINELKARVAHIDLCAASKRLDAGFADNKLSVKMLGKDLSIDSKGNLTSDIHIHTWVAVPFLNYIITGKDIPLSGNWVPLRELPGGKDWYRLFGQTCEKPLKKIADTYTDLFEDMIHIFNGQQVENHYESDISLVLYPLPKVPILICYWKPEDGLESDFNIFFDSTAEDHLDIKSIYSLAAGLTLMFQKLSLRHGSHGR
jgi:hypothetical protein